MRGHDTGGYLGHSNDSLMAGADEMAGRTVTVPLGNSRLTRDVSAQPESNNRFTPTNQDPFMEPFNPEMIHYPMPEQAEPWTQADHPDSIHRFTHEEGEPIMEAFRGAARIFSHANPEIFTMPLEARILCMKVDKLSDMKYCIANGAVTNLPSCNARIQAAWDERDGERVFMMFSISGDKEFCAMAEMMGPVRPGSLPGWSKPGCSGVTLITFIYIKNVPFKLINHIKNKANKQPVANMWNSMLYSDNTGYHVAKIFVEHPVLSSLLVTYRSEMQTDYKSQLRLASSGNTSYSASSYGTNNNKSHDPRSATRTTIQRSGNRSQGSGNRRDAIQAQPWRRDEIPPTPSRPLLIAGAENVTPSTTNSQHRGLVQQQGIAQASPPRFTLAERPAPSRSGGSHTTHSFTTNDDRIFADFASSRGIKNQDATLPSQSSGGHQPAHANARGGLNTGRGGASSRGNPRHNAAPSAPVNTSGSANVRGGHPNNPYDVQWQNSGRTAQVPIFMDNSVGNGYGASYQHQGQTMAQTGESIVQRPSSGTSTQPSHKSSSQQSEEQRRLASQGYTTPSTPFARNESAQSYARAAPQSAQRLITAVTLNASYSDQADAVKPPSPMKHSQSMPLMGHQPTHRLSAKHLNAHATSFKPQDAKALVSSSSPGIEQWVSRTPTRASFEPEQTPVEGTDLTVSTIIDTEENDSPVKIEEKMRFMNLEQQIKWQKARMRMLEAEIELGELESDTHAKKASLLKYLEGKVEMLELDIVVAHNRHDEARGDLAQPTEDHPPQSPGTPHHSDQWPTRVTSSSIESDYIAPEVDEKGKVYRSISKNREGKATHIDQKQKLRHARGQVGSQGFSGSFDARMRASVNDLTASPTRTHGHPLQRSSERLVVGEYDSANGDHYYQGESTVEDDDASSSFDVLSQIDDQEHQGNIFTTRGRGYWTSEHDSQMSHQHGAHANDKYGFK